MALQYGVPLEALVKKFAHQRFEPSGFTKNPEIRNASSIIDYVFRWMALQFIPEYREASGVKQPDLPMPGLLEEIKKKVNRPVPELPISEETESIPGFASSGQIPSDALKFTGLAGGQNRSFDVRVANGHREITNLSEAIAHFQQDAPICPNCGHVTVRNGACYKCLNCGESLGCS
jgi:ribonucleoside-diphosphate reductase alpha chain